jgi:hypothetical protein
MRRRADGEVVARMRLSAFRQEVAALRRMIVRWINDCLETLKSSQPELPDLLDDRAADGWEPLLAIADVAGGRWPSLARETALALSAGRAEADESKGDLLLCDVREIFGERERVTSEELAHRLGGMEDRPWSEWGSSRKPITPAAIARQLKPFGIKPANQKQNDGRVLKGYERSDFGDAWARYCPTPKRYPLPTVEALGKEGPGACPSGSAFEILDTTRDGSG